MEHCGTPGNQFWKIRSKHGRDKLFATPELLKEAADEYFQWCEDNPFFETDFRGKDAIEVKIPKIRPFTIQGLCLFFDANTLWFNQFESDCKEKNDDLSKDFNKICLYIRQTIYNQKFSAAAAGQLNHNIIARDLGLVDKKENEVKINKPVIIDWTGQPNTQAEGGTPRSEG